MTGRALLGRAGVTDPGVPGQRLEGGDISTVERFGPWVVKTRPGAPDGLFESEARGLAQLGAAGCRVPIVRYVDPDGIVLGWLPPGPPDWRDLAEQLARLHTTPAAAYGLEHPVFIGPIPLPARSGALREVWWEGRMAPVIARCSGLGSLRARLEQMAEVAQPPLEGPVWVHGDLWSGNVHMASAGAAVIDPSCWAGERSVDLAMMTLFGGFPPAFWATYRALAPIPPEVEAWLPYWRVYFLLVHVALFGSGYLPGVERELLAVSRLCGRPA